MVRSPAFDGARIRDEGCDQVVVETLCRTFDMWSDYMYETRMAYAKASHEHSRIGDADVHVWWIPQCREVVLKLKKRAIQLALTCVIEARFAVRGLTPDYVERLDAAIERDDSNRAVCAIGFLNEVLVIVDGLDRASCDFNDWADRTAVPIAAMCQADPDFVRRMGVPIPESLEGRMEALDDDDVFLNMLMGLWSNLLHLPADKQNFDD